MSNPGTRSQQQQRRSHAPPLDRFDWRGASVGIALMGCIAAIGPFTLLLTWVIRAWCTRSKFDPDDRWNAIRTFAWLLTPLPVLIILAFFVRPTLALHFWNLSPLHFLGAPDLFANLWLRWLGSLPLALVLSFVLEQGDRRTIRWFMRVKTAEELAQEADARRRATEQAARRRAEEQTRLERERAEEVARAERAAVRKASARRRAAAALANELAPEVHKKTTTLDEHPPTLWEQATLPAAPPVEPPTQKKQKSEKPDLGDGSMDALL